MNDPRPPLPVLKLHRQLTEYPPLGPGAPAVCSQIWSLALNRQQTGRTATGGCSYGGQVSTMWAPLRDLLHVTNGPAGCGVYAQANWAMDGDLDGTAAFSHLNLSTDFQECDVVFGGEKKLAQAIAEADLLFPLNRGMSVLSTCPVALIGDDIDAVARQQEKALAKPVTPVHCAGYRRGDGIGAIHATIAATWRNWNVQAQPADGDARSVTLLCREMGGAWRGIKALLEDMGLKVIARWPGGGSYDQTARLGVGRLVVSVGMEYWAKLLQREFGQPWVDVDLLGPSATRDSLRVIAAHFDAQVQGQTERLIAERDAEAKALASAAREQLQGRLFFSFGLVDPKDARVYADFGIRVGSSLQGWPEPDGRWRMPEHPGRPQEMTPEQVKALLDAVQPDLVDGLAQDGHALRKQGYALLDERNRMALARCACGYAGMAGLAREFTHLFNPPARHLLNAPWR